jgi:ubiquinone/menaquinone biosynthesis C-methylase UbiE
MNFIEIGERNYLLYLLLPHPLKISLLSAASRSKLDRINVSFNERIYSGDQAMGYDEIHGYDEAAQHEYPARALVEDIWGAEGYGRALELGAGSGYFSMLIARKAESLIAVELVPDMQSVLRRRCQSAGLQNVEVVGASAFDLATQVPSDSIDSALVLHSLHHLHRREEVITALARTLRPGGRLLMVEPHHNVRRVARLLRNYMRTYRATEFWTKEINWATHDFVTCGEIRTLCRRAGLVQVTMSGFWFPYSRRFVPNPQRRFRLERFFGGLPVIRHFGSVLAVEARRGY